MAGERRALVVRGGWDGHMPVETTDLFIPFLRDNGFDVQVSESTAVYADESAMADVDLIVQIVTMSTIADDEFAGLQEAVLGGAGLAGWHGGIADAFRNTADYLHMVGGQFAHHAAKPRQNGPASSRTTTSRTRCTSPRPGTSTRSRGASRTSTS